MKGNSLNEFMNDLYVNGGPEKEFIYRVKTFFFSGATLAECVKRFEKAKIFDGKTIYEAEKDIEVLFG